ncbi:conserved phage C-terminal domain-containing protein [Clostridioides difficile]|uniref:conserved phage C-terminal domain-containing protein n=4 Tax=Clostridioides difficile TaxID=1496 RepID=UPI00097FEA8E|nr:conserved phage C-terminal domain-containing protein [Clostridioides difficile]SJW88302.1 phage replication initiation protein [Clostridioides difficile]
MELLKDSRKRDWFWVENDLIDREDLTIYEKMIYITLVRHSNENSICFPSYRTIAQKSGCSERQAKKIVKDLEKKKLIKKENRTKKNSKEKESNIYIVLSTKVSSECDAQQVVNMMHDGSECDAQQVVNEVHSNKTNINKTKLTNNIYSSAEQKEEKTKDKEIYKRIVDYLNKAADKSFKSTTKKTISLIDARLKEGFTEEEFYRAIDNKVLNWLDDDKMNAYLRPETLFGNKFESYLNETPKKALKGNESVKGKIKSNNNKFANFNQTFDKYSEKELDAIIKKSQSFKFK